MLHTSLHSIIFLSCFLCYTFPAASVKVHRAANHNPERREAGQSRRPADAAPSEAPCWRTQPSGEARREDMRIKLDLSDFLEDERKFSVLKVKPKETKTVRDVISKISQLFSVYGEECGQDDDQTRARLGLFDEEFYIHPDETATVLEDCGVLKLKALPKPGTKGKKKKKSKKEPISVVIAEEDERKNLQRDVEEENKALEVQEMKDDWKSSQATSKHGTRAEWFEGVERKKTSKKRKRCQFAEEVEELHGKKRSKIEDREPNLDESRGEQHLKEWQEVESGEKKKRKKQRISKEISISDTSQEEQRGKKKKEHLQQPSKDGYDMASSHKKSEQHPSKMEQPHLKEWKKQRLKDDKGGGSSSSSSQDKVVSTSSFFTSLEGALAAMKNRSVPEVFSGVRAMGVRPIQRRSGTSAPVRPPMANGSPGPASQNTTVLPADDPLEILSSNLSEIQQQYNQGRQSIQASTSDNPIQAGTSDQPI
ncbi:hypothetical protein E2C01_006936 [Portunus trituberculatus]|uniref:Coilin n=1 Tax=Portunus trituberculatus TaxID=210409 RepID=A0A5B7CXT8_PORTR|nr:hypothetical protein [Portunus trituberculatus]